MEKQINDFLITITKDITELGLNNINKKENKTDNTNQLVNDTLNNLYKQIKDTSKKLDETIKLNIRK